MSNQNQSHAASFMVTFGGQQFGPHTSDEIEAMLASGMIDGSALVGAMAGQTGFRCPRSQKRQRHRQRMIHPPPSFARRLLQSVVGPEPIKSGLASGATYSKSCWWSGR